MKSKYSMLMERVDFGGVSMLQILGDFICYAGIGDMNHHELGWSDYLGNIAVFLYGIVSED